MRNWIKCIYFTVLISFQMVYNVVVFDAVSAAVEISNNKSIADISSIWIEFIRVRKRISNNNNK